MVAKLHEHQAECVAAVESAFGSGIKRTLAVLATGAGKTMIYLHLVNLWANQGKRILILAHRRELIHQPLERAQEFFPALAKKMGIVMAASDQSEAQVVIATVQTAVRDRLVGEFDYVVLDECHHGTSNMYKKMFAQYPEAFWLGVTATPFRTDGRSMSSIFQHVSYRFPITAAVERGILVPFEAYGFSLPISVEGVTETVEGWDEKVLGDLLSANNVLEIVFEKWKQYCSDRLTFVFTASVSQAYATAMYFKSKGIQAEAVDGKTPKKQRDGILKAFKAGRLQVLCNCQVFTEGVDVPQASAALMVCPTKSDLSYVQKLGRILRTYKNKTNAIVLDFAPLEDRNIVMAGDILGAPRIFKETEAAAKKSGIMVRASRVDTHGLTATIDPNELIVEVLKYLRKGLLAWSLQDNLTVASLSDSVMLAIELPDGRRIGNADKLKSNKVPWTAPRENLYQYLKQYKFWIFKKGANWQPSLMGTFPTIEEAMALSDKITNANFQPALATRRKAWRGKPASEAQRSYMTRLEIEVPDPCTQGQAAQLISHEIARNTINRVREQVERKVMNGDQT